LSFLRIHSKGLCQICDRGTGQHHRRQDIHRQPERRPGLHVLDFTHERRVHADGRDRERDRHGGLRLRVDRGEQ
jgi:hypothetical protein